MPTSCCESRTPILQESLYVQREPYTRLLLGPRYALLRREFVSWSHSEREIEEVARNILVMMGGSDPDKM